MNSAVGKAKQLIQSGAEGENLPLIKDLVAEIEFQRRQDRMLRGEIMKVVREYREIYDYSQLLPLIDRLEEVAYYPEKLHNETSNGSESPQDD